jgi:predicted metal-dependent phosphoesterase TrpH
VLAITDHNDMEGCGEAERLAEGMIIIPGIEISSKGGHIIGLGLTRPVPRGLEVSETIRQIHQAGGIAIAPHPYRMSTGLGEQNIRSNDFDAIEVANGRSRRGGNWAARMLAEEMKLPGVGGSDAHDLRSLGRALTEVPDDCRTKEDVITAIKAGRCSAKGAGQSSTRSLSSAFMNTSRWFRRGLRRM